MEKQIVGISKIKEQSERTLCHSILRRELPQGCSIFRVDRNYIIILVDAGKTLVFISIKMFAKKLSENQWLDIIILAT